MAKYDVLVSLYYGISIASYKTLTLPVKLWFKICLQ